MAFCRSCGNELKDDNEFCPNCGQATTKAGNPYEQESFVDESISQANHDFSYLPLYYQEEFKKVVDTNEVYKGKWNWAAFFFGAFWAISKGLWLPAVIAFVGSIFTDGIIGFIYSIIFGIRGNYMYYNKIVKGKQTIV